MTSPNVHFNSIRLVSLIVAKEIKMKMMNILFMHTWAVFTCVFSFCEGHLEKIGNFGKIIQIFYFKIFSNE